MEEFRVHQLSEILGEGDQPVCPFFREVGRRQPEYQSLHAAEKDRHFH